MMAGKMEYVVSIVKMVSYRRMKKWQAQQKSVKKELDMITWPKREQKR
jgi:preprotein translocase subunit SecE